MKIETGKWCSIGQWERSTERPWRPPHPHPPAFGLAGDDRLPPTPLALGSGLRCSFVVGRRSLSQPVRVDAKKQWKNPDCVGLDAINI